jgi:RNA polymerase sigma-70 factor (ECF subfamily)
MTTARDTKGLVEAEAETALDAIYREHFEFVWSVLRRLGVDEADVDDASQDVFVIAHRRLSQFEGRAAVRTWLYSIAMRVAANRRRKHVRRDALLAKLPRAVPDDLEELAARGQARAILERLLDRLDESKRVVFVLAELEELTVPAIADLIGENPRTIYSRLRAARAAVASDLDRLHAPQPIDLGAAIVATRPRGAVEPERARRAWAAVLAKIGLGGSAAPVVATGFAAWGKIAIAAAATIGVTTWAVLPEREPTTTPVAATAPDERTAPQPAAASPNTPVITASTTPVVRPPIEPPAPRAAPRRIDGPEPTPTEALADEIAAIDRARALIETDPAAALAELDRYDARFVNGTMRSEAAGVRVAALCKAGRDDQAREAATAAGLAQPRCAAAGLAITRPSAAATTASPSD